MRLRMGTLQLLSFSLCVYLSVHLREGILVVCRVAEASCLLNGYFQYTHFLLLPQRVVVRLHPIPTTEYCCNITALYSQNCNVMIA
ncbi:unnamed protein product [Gongylonema pulchrum]|uniref:Secreted protein n=1 Tax=Gongylonema pulchrum TaxID=637853 RepID=A0A3P6QG37_9BILA|nr:unnamed protein product [Gongylonema pulchrum]